jgi:hypothetical protein
LTTTPEERERLIEEVASAHRPADPRGGLAPSPAFADLDEEGRRAAFEVGTAMRALESALDPEGLSTTARAVLRAIQRARP